MNMRIDIDEQLRSLDSLRKRMGAHKSNFEATVEDLGEIEKIGQLLEEGLDDIQLADVVANSGGLLEYKGYQVVLYIPDQDNMIENVLIDGSKGKKFHVMDCRTLQHMRAVGRGNRYSVRNGIGKTFPVHGRTQFGKILENQLAELVVCKNCLTELNFKGYKTHVKQRSIIFRDFDLEDFFTTYSSYFKHKPVGADTRRANEYTNNWKQVSTKFRSSRNWICDNCKVDLSAPNHKHLLHTHHINGQRSDNRDANFKALCKDCHSKEPYHERLYISHKDRLLINQLRRKQQKFHQKPKPGQQEDSVWLQAIKEADPAVHGLLERLKERRKAVPEVGADMMGREGEIIAEAELVWESKHIAVVLDIGKQEKIELEAMGWRIGTAKEMLDSL